MRRKLTCPGSCNGSRKVRKSQSRGLECRWRGWWRSRKIRICDRWASHATKYGSPMISMLPCRMTCWPHSMANRPARLRAASVKENEVSAGHGGLAVESEIARAYWRRRPPDIGTWRRGSLPVGSYVLGDQHQDAFGKTGFSRTARTICAPIHGEAGSSATLHYPQSRRESL